MKKNCILLFTLFIFSCAPEKSDYESPYIETPSTPLPQIQLYYTIDSVPTFLPTVNRVPVSLMSANVTPCIRYLNIEDRYLDNTINYFTLMKGYQIYISDSYQSMNEYFSQSASYISYKPFDDSSIVVNPYNLVLIIHGVKDMSSEYNVIRNIITNIAEHIKGTSYYNDYQRIKTLFDECISYIKAETGDNGMSALEVYDKLNDYLSNAINIQYFTKSSSGNYFIQYPATAIYAGEPMTFTLYDGNDISYISSSMNWRLFTIRFNNDYSAKLSPEYAGDPTPQWDEDYYFRSCSLINTSYNSSDSDEDNQILERDQNGYLRLNADANMRSSEMYSSINVLYGWYHDDANNIHLDFITSIVVRPPKIPYSLNYHNVSFDSENVLVAAGENVDLRVNYEYEYYYNIYAYQNYDHQVGGIITPVQGDYSHYLLTFENYSQSFIPFIAELQLLATQYSAARSIIRFYPIFCDWYIDVNAPYVWGDQITFNLKINNIKQYFDNLYLPLNQMKASLYYGNQKIQDVTSDYISGISVTLNNVDYKYLYLKINEVNNKYIITNKQSVSIVKPTFHINPNSLTMNIDTAFNAYNNKFQNKYYDLFIISDYSSQIIYNIPYTQTTIEYDFEQGVEYTIKAEMVYNTGYKYSTPEYTFIAGANGTENYFEDLKSGDYIYPQICNLKIRYYIGQYNQSLTFYTSAGLLTTSSTATTGTSSLSVTTDAKGFATVYLYARKLPADTTLNIWVQQDGAEIDRLSSLIVKDNSSFQSINSIILDTNAVVTIEFGTNIVSESVRIIQMMLNQVCPRKVTTAFGLEGIPRYDIIDEDGIFYSQTSNAVYYLMRRFIKATNTFCMTVPAFSNDTRLFIRLTNQYESLRSMGANARYCFVDWKLLRGGLAADPAYLLAVHSDADVVAQGRDGLFELYNNVVSNFIEQMIAAGQTYVDYNDHGWFGRDDDDGVDTQLNDSDGQVTSDVSCEWITQGVAYSYASIDRIEDFTTKLEEQNDVTEDDNWCDYDAHKVGLHSREHAYWFSTAPGGYSGDPLLSPLVWAGIDCRGFIQRICKTPVYNNGNGLIINNILVPDYGTGLEMANIRQNIGCPNYRWVPDEFLDNTTLAEEDEANRRANTYWIINSGESLKYIHRGDIITTTGHVVLIYEEPLDDQSTDFDIMNASGYWKLNISGTDTFARRTIIFPFNLWKNDYSLRKEFDDIRFGRFTLWVR